MDINTLRERLAAVPTVATRGRVRSVVGLSLRAILPAARIGDVVLVRRPGGPLAGEVVGFEGDEAVVMPLG